MKAPVKHSALAFGLAALAIVGCKRDENKREVGTPAANEPSATEQRRAEERRAEERRAEERSPQPRPIGGGPTEPGIKATTASALASIAAARCDREVRCKNVGTKEKYATRDECIAKVKEDKRDDINAKDCPGGVHEKQLNECLQAIRTEDCGNPLDAISRLSACRSGALCVSK
jgi:Family of unknown function (DUF6184)